MVIVGVIITNYSLSRHSRVRASVVGGNPDIQVKTGVKGL